MSQQERIEELRRLTSLSSLAIFLGFTPKKLSYILYKLNNGPNGQYTDFEIRKRSGGTRVISAPSDDLKAIQQSLNKALQRIYYVKKSVHGFIPGGRGILSNASNHGRKRYVFKIDLKDFFPSIHFGRIRGLFRAKPYQFHNDIAILLAKIACYNDALPQGSPCSPVLSNMICAYMDKQLSDYAKDHGCFYTRYADDLTFSSNKTEFPEAVAIKENGEWKPSDGLTNIISQNSFTINPIKTSLRTRSERQLVTGLVVNEHPNIRRKSLKQVRSMLHDWKVNGLEKAQEKHLELYDLKNRPEGMSDSIDFTKVVRGKLEHIKQVRDYRIKVLNHLDEQERIRNQLPPRKDTLHLSQNEQYYRYLLRYKQLRFRDCGMPTILGEGETDWMHFRKALAALKDDGKFTDLELNIYKHKKFLNGGFNHLLNFCKNATNMYVHFTHPIICVFDRDLKHVNKDYEDQEFVCHGNNVYSMIIAKPKHRESDLFAIEQLYLNKDLFKADKNKRRVFLNNEFRKNGKHKKDPNFFYGKRAKDGAAIKGWEKHIKDADKGIEKILDTSVCQKKDGKLINVALSKRDFARKIMRNEPPFYDIDFSGFESTFEIIKKICAE